VRRPLLLACLLACTPPAPPLTASPDDAPLTLAPGQAAELSVAADGHATARLTTTTGSERFVVILASSRFDSVADAPPTAYTVQLGKLHLGKLPSPGAADALSPHRLLDGCSFSSDSFSNERSSERTVTPPGNTLPTGPAPTEGATRTLYCAGQTSVDENGAPQHAGDMGAQIALAADNLDAVLRAAGMTFANVVRLNFYTTDVESYLANAGVIGERLGAAGVAPAGTLLGVARLAFPELLIEIEATAVA